MILVRDSELDRLKSEQDRAFAQKQEAYQNKKRLDDEKDRLYEISQNAWQRRSSARDEMNREYEHMQSERSRNDAIWDNYKKIRDSNNWRIDDLTQQADDLYQRMVSSFEQASDAYNYGDKSLAPEYAAEGRQYQALLKSVNAEKSRLCNEVKSAREHAESFSDRIDSSAFRSAKAQFEAAKREHEIAELAFKEAKQRAELAKKEFEHAKQNHKSAQDAFQQRLRQVKNEKKRRRDSDEDLMNRANIPYYYRDRCKVKREPDGTTNFYFGGIGDSDGFGHAHISMDSSGDITYNRDVFDAHGAKNFSDYQERLKEYEMKKKQRNGWDSEIIHGILDETDELVAMKYKYRNGNISDILIARDTQDSDLEDITKENEQEHPHVHAWYQDTEEPNHHDMKYGNKMFPKYPGKF